MRRFLLALAIALTLVAGCKKIRLANTQPVQAQQQQPQQQQPQEQQPPGQPAVHAPTGVVLNPNPQGGGGGGGAAMAIKKAAGRAVTQNDMQQIRIFIENASVSSGKMPTREEVLAALKTGAPTIHKQCEDQVIWVTGTRSRENIWAYTVNTVSSANYHLILSSSGIEQIGTEALKERLKREQGQ